MECSISRFHIISSRRGFLTAIGFRVFTLEFGRGGFFIFFFLASVSLWAASAVKFLLSLGADDYEYNPGSRRRDRFFYVLTRSVISGDGRLFPI